MDPVAFTKLLNEYISRYAVLDPLNMVIPAHQISPGQMGWLRLVPVVGQSISPVHPMLSPR